MKSIAPFPIVGIGASAGGLKAFIQFFEEIPEQPGMAFVVIQHLAPQHESLMPELLSRHTHMDVKQVQDRTNIEKNKVYIIPPGKYLGIEGDDLILSNAPSKKGKRMAIDHFFSTLAEARQERAICIVMSGTGSDGTQGLKSVKSAGGLALVQDPETAEFDRMPRSAVRTGAADRVLKISEMPEALLQYAKHPYVREEADDPGSGGNKNESVNLKKILSELHEKTGHEFHTYKKNTLRRRIQRRMSFHHIETLEEYHVFLQKNTDETEELFKDLLINVTSFFREPHAWRELARQTLPSLLEKCEASKSFRIWAPGCSTGEEAYTTAILYSELLEREATPCDVKIFATDIDQEALATARAGLFSFSIEKAVSPERLERFFTKKSEGYLINKRIREMVLFAPQSLISDPPFSKMDLVICRNLLIYLEPKIQKDIIESFHFALEENGYLFLGNSETVGSHYNLFKTLSKKWRIYKRIGGTRSGYPKQPSPWRKPQSGSLQDSQKQHDPNRSLPKIAQQILVERFAPAAVIVDRNLDILYYNGPTHEFLRQPKGAPTHNLLEQTDQKLRIRLRQALQKKKDTCVTESITIQKSKDAYALVEFTVQPLPETIETEGLVLVSFRHHKLPHSNEMPSSHIDTTQAEEDETAVSHLEKELKATRNELQATVEEKETSNEEIMSMNEELQSTNEELETSKEELQSLNEELTTVNNELHEKILELENTNDDIENLLVNTKIATVFLDRELKIRRFTPAATKVFHIISSDVGRPLSSIGRRFQDKTLREECERVLEKLLLSEKEIINEENSYFLRRIQPYRTADNQVAGVVLNFVDISSKRRSEIKVRESEKRFRRAITFSPLPIIIYTEDGEVLSVSKAWEEISGYGLKDIPTMKDWTHKAYGDKSGIADEHLEKLFRQDTRLDEGQWTIQTKKGEERVWHFHSSPIGQLPDGRRLVISTALDETELSQSRTQLERHRDILEEEVQNRTHKLENKNLQLRRMATQLSQTEQRERRRLASTLHDNMQQLIAAARMKISMTIEGNKALQKEFTKPMELLSEAAKECQDLAVQLAPPVLYDAGFMAALRWLCDWVEDHYHLKVIQSFKTDKEPEDEEIQILLFQSVRELLYNVVKHSGQHECVLGVETSESDWLKVSVTDHGKGLNPGEVKTESTQNGFGLFSIRERLSMMGGSFRVESINGKGTCIFLEAPLMKLDDMPLIYPEDAATH